MIEDVELRAPRSTSGDSNSLPVLRAPYLLFLGDVQIVSDAKTAFGIVYWRRERCCGQLRLAGCKADTGLPDLDLEQARRAGARSLIIGIASVGGAFQPQWIETICAAARLGLDIVSGMHNSLHEIPGLTELAAAHGARLIDVRVPPSGLRVGNGAKRPGRRLLTVGTDCAVGKKYTALSIDRALRERGRKVTFRATGQTGIMIAGRGIPIDAVVSDFVAGAAEALSPANDPDHWDIVEGQGSLFNPSFAAVTLGLLHGSQPDAIVLCHDLSRTAIEDVVGYPIPPLDVCIARYIEAAQLTNPQVRCIGIAVNGSGLAAADYLKARAAIQAETGLPCVDPIHDGVDPLIEALEAAFGTQESPA